VTRYLWVCEGKKEKSTQRVFLQCRKKGKKKKIALREGGYFFHRSEEKRVQEEIKRKRLRKKKKVFGRQVTAIRIIGKGKKKREFPTPCT